MGTFFTKRHKQAAAAVTIAVLFGLALNALLVAPSAESAVVGQTNGRGAAATTATCTLARPSNGDTSFVVVTSSKSVSSVADSASNTYTERAATSLATGTLGAYVYFYLANVTAGYGSQITVTVTLSATGYLGVECIDIAGIGVHPDHTSTGTGLLNGSTSFYVCDSVGGVNTYCVNHQGLSVTSYQPPLGDFVISATADYGCYATAGATDVGYPGESAPIPSDDDYVHGPGTQASPFYPSIAIGNTVSISTSTSCGSGGDVFQFIGVGSYKKIWPSGSTPTIQNFSTTTMPDEITTNSANFAVLSASFPSNTVVSTSESSDVSLTVHASTAATSSNNAHTLSLTPIVQIPTLIAHALDLFPIVQQPQESPSSSICLGLKANLTDGSYVVNTGAICGAPTVAGATLITACTFFQFQCWAIPLMYLGMIDGFFMGVAGAFRVTEKSALYLIIAGLTWGSLVEISLGIMTPMLPILLITANVAYSFRLDKSVTQLLTNGRNGSQ